MRTYNKIINDYLSERDTNLKRFILQRKLESSFSLNLVVDDLLFKCGLISVNVVTVLHKKNKYRAYVTAQSENIFDLDKGSIELIDNPVSYSKAQEVLAQFIIKKFDKVDYLKFIERVNNWS